MREVVVLPLVPLTTIDPQGNCAARASTSDGSSRVAINPGRAVPPPFPSRRDAVADALPARTAAVRRGASLPGCRGRLEVSDVVTVESNGCLEQRQQIVAV